jgi:hypothetical protein
MMMHPALALAGGLVFLLGGNAGGPAAAAQYIACPGTDAHVEAGDSRDAEAGCRGAADAVAFLARQGLRTAVRIEIRFVDRLPAPESALSHGCYVSTETRIYMRGFSACRALAAQGGIPVDRALHRALVAHEVAHRIAAANFAVPKPTLVAQEYIAYVTMFATMPPDARARLLERLPGSGFDSERQINATYYGFDPNRFGAQAYRHYLRPENGPPFIAHVLAGKALTDDDPP